MQLRPLTKALTVQAVLGLLFFSLPSWAGEPNQLNTLRNNLANKRLTAIQPILTAYRRQLDELGQTLLLADNSEGARFVQQEKGAIDRELAELVKAAELAKTAEAQAVVTAPPAPPPPPPPPPPKPHEPRTFVNSVQGLAGAASFSKNNVYTFNLPEIGASSTLTFYATGRRSKDSFGNVWLINPEGRKTKVTKWKSANFTTPAVEIKSYQDLKPITTDIAEYVKTPGTYQLEFEWTDGVDPLVIFRVEMIS